MVTLIDCVRGFSIKLFSMYCFAKVCRLCLRQQNLVHLATRDKHNLKLHQKIRAIFPLLINKTSKHFPIWICTKCQEQVNDSYEFKQKCYKTYRLLRKYTSQLHEANSGNSVPDVPSELLQEIKPGIYNTVIVLDEESRSDTYYNADDITIVKNELLPNNLKNEPEYHDMIQSIIDNNIEAVRDIDGDGGSAADLKRETIRNNESVPEADPAPNVNTPEDSTNTTEQTETTNPLTAFTLDYTNASFETFASHVGPKITATAETRIMEIAQQITSCKRVLRQRKSICYRTMEKCLDDSTPAVRKTRSPQKTQTEKKIPKTPTKKPQPIETPKKNKRATEISDKIITRNKNGVYFCNRCSKQYKRFPPFKAHAIKCKGYGRYQCPECDKDFANLGNLQRHRKTSHVVLKLKMKCSLCPNQYVSTVFFRRHMQLHHNLAMDKSHPFFQ